MGGGLVSRQMMHAPLSATISVSNRFGSAQADEIFDQLSELCAFDYPIRTELKLSGIEPHLQGEFALAQVNR